MSQNPSIDPVIVAIITAAVDQSWPRPMVAAEETGPVTPAWRFSGRWWRAPVTSRRDRPQTGF